MTAPNNIDINALREAAKNGDAAAQYMLAATLTNAGNRVEADHWLKISADLGYGEALYTLATREFKSSTNLSSAYDLLKRGSEGGSMAAKRLLGVVCAEGYGIAADWQQAVAAVVGAARDGDAGAMAEIAMLLFAKDPDDEDGASLITKASEDNPCAAAVLVRRAAMGRKHSDVTHAGHTLRRLSHDRYRNSTSLDTALSAQSEQSVFKAGDVDWDGVIEKLSDWPGSAALDSETVCEKPSARVYRNALTPEECEYIIANSIRHLGPSLIVDPTTGKARRDNYRNSLTAVYSPVDLDLAIATFNRRIADIAGYPHENGEFLGVLCYVPGQEYKPHFDWLPNGAELERSGQRIGTALVYLNNEYDGGETHFLTPDIRFKGDPGDLLVFKNVLADGSTDDAAQHAGLPVGNGFKWLISRWFREKKYNF